MNHGLYYYTYKKCRCKICKQAKHEYDKAYRQRPGMKQKFKAYRDTEEAKRKRLAYRRTPEVKEKSREYESREHVKNRNRTRRNVVANLHRRLVSELKLKLGCVDCGFNKHPAALQFDHITGIKKKNVSAMLHHSWKSILAEIEKCELRCSNCHAIKHHPNFP